VRTIAAIKRYSDGRAAKFAGQLLTEDAYDTLITDDCDVTKPDGSYLIRFRKNVFSTENCIAAARNLRDAAKLSKNRGTAAGTPEPAANEVRVSKNRVKRVLEDGTLSNTAEAKSVQSGIVGYFNANPRTPYCRLTAFNLEHPERFAAAMPLFRSADAHFHLLMPDRWEAQRRYIERTSPDFVIHGTVFTTITVNANWQTAVHQDAGDLKAGFGVMTVLRSGVFDGCYLCFPQYRVAVDMRTRCICLADVHEWHGNTPFRGVEGEFERLSLVMYYREKMEHCGSAAEELEKAKAR
jgi:hypothetical protein